MKLKIAAYLVVSLLPMSLMAQPAPTPSAQPTAGAVTSKPMMAPPPSTEMPPKDKLTIALGMYFGNQITNSLKRGDIEVDTNALLAVVADVVNGKPAKMSEKEYGDIFTQLRGAMMAHSKAKEAEAKAKGDEFLAQYAKGAGVTTMTNGLEYKVIKDGTGPTPKDTDTVTVAYRGTLIDGTEFDHNDSFSTPVHGRIIQGWQSALSQMKVGSKWQVAIPPMLGYGPRGMPPRIPGNSVLVFDMELKSITAGAPTLPPLSGPTPGANKPPTPPTPTAPVVSGEIIKVPSADELKKGAKIEVIKAGQTNTVNSQ